MRRTRAALRRTRLTFDTADWFAGDVETLLLRRAMTETDLREHLRGGWRVAPTAIRAWSFGEWDFQRELRRLVDDGYIVAHRTFVAGKANVRMTEYELPTESEALRAALRRAAAKAENGEGDAR